MAPLHETLDGSSSASGWLADQQEESAPVRFLKQLRAVLASRLPAVETVLEGKGADMDLLVNDLVTYAWESRSEPGRLCVSGTGQIMDYLDLVPAARRMDEILRERGQ